MRKWIPSISNRATSVSLVSQDVGLDPRTFWPLVVVCKGCWWPLEEVNGLLFFFILGDGVERLICLENDTCLIVIINNDCGRNKVQGYERGLSLSFKEDWSLSLNWNLCSLILGRV